MARAGVMGSVEQRLDLRLVDEGNHRRERHADRDAGPGQPADRLEPPPGCRRARLEVAREAGIERGQGDHRVRQAVACHRGEQVDVALDQAALRDQRQRMAAAREDLDAAAREPQPPLDRLPGIGDRADRDRVAAIAAPRQLGLQQDRRIDLREQARLEVEARRQPEVGVPGPRIAVHAAVLAAAIRVDGRGETDVRRLVADDDRAGRLLGHHRGRAGRVRRTFGIGGPAVVDRLACIAREAARGAGYRAPPPDDRPARFHAPSRRCTPPQANPPGMPDEILYEYTVSAAARRRPWLGAPGRRQALAMPDADGRTPESRVRTDRFAPADGRAAPEATPARAAGASPVAVSAPSAVPSGPARARSRAAPRALQAPSAEMAPAARRRR